PALFALEQAAAALPPPVRRRLLAAARTVACDPSPPGAGRPPTPARSPALPVIGAGIVLVAAALLIARPPRPAAHGGRPKLAAAPAGAVARWTFDQPLTTAVEDVSGNGHRCLV